MLKHITALVLVWIVIAPAAATSQVVVFDKKYFTDNGNFVGVEGSPATDGASPDNTTRWVFWCYQERRECSEFFIKAAGGGPLVSILPGIPLAYSIKVWAPDRIVAELELGCGDRETLLLDRLRKTAEVFGGSCGDKTRPTHQTIEDPPAWTKFKKRIDELLQSH
jgi:hypothetical protein